jgi:hypothetical protein
MRMRMVGEPAKQRVTWLPLGAGLPGKARPLQQQQQQTAFNAHK